MSWSDKPRDWSPIPDHLRTALKHYVDAGRIPGELLTGILSNELDKTADSCDAKLFAQIPVILAFLRMQLPGMCWGSGERLAFWERVGGLKGLEEFASNNERD